MPETLQNLDIQQPNPFTPDTSLDSTDITPQKLPKNPKIVLLTILGSIIVVLLLLSAIVSASRNTKNNAPTPTPIISPHVLLQTTTPDQTLIIPTIYQIQFNDLDNATQETVDFPPPQTDPSVGLTPNQ